MTRVLICGDRNWKDTTAIQRCVDSLPASAVIIEGGARGADSIAAACGVFRGLVVLHFPADWNRHGKAAGPIRNRQMLTEGKPDIVIFFHNNLKGSRGTRDMVKISWAKGLPVINGCSVQYWDKCLDLHGVITEEDGC